MFTINLDYLWRSQQMCFRTVSVLRATLRLGEPYFISFYESCVFKCKKKKKGNLTNSFYRRRCYRGHVKKIKNARLARG